MNCVKFFPFNFENFQAINAITNQHKQLRNQRSNAGAFCSIVCNQIKIIFVSLPFNFWVFYFWRKKRKKLLGGNLRRVEVNDVRRVGPRTQQRQAGRQAAYKYRQ